MSDRDARLLSLLWARAHGKLQRQRNVERQASVGLSAGTA